MLTRLVHAGWFARLAALALLALCFCLSIWTRFYSGWAPVEHFPAPWAYFFYGLLSSGLWFVWAERFDLFGTLHSETVFSRWLSRLGKVDLLTLAVISIAAFFWREHSFSRFTVGLFWVLHGAMTGFLGWIARKALNVDARPGCEVWLAGEDLAVEPLRAHFAWEQREFTIRRFGDEAMLARSLDPRAAVEIRVALAESQLGAFAEIFRRLDAAPYPTCVLIARGGKEPGFLETPAGASHVNSFEYEVVKRLFDAVAAALALVLLSPLLAAVAAVIAWRVGRPVLFAQQRVGRHGRRFQMWKFRTLPLEEPAASDTRWKAEPADPWAEFLRASGLDELPQLWHVLRGEMSLVGPRPERPYFVRRFQRAWPFYAARHKLQVGITGWAQTNGLRGNTSIPRRVEYDLYYLRRWSLWFDLRILVRTGLGLAATFWRHARAVR